MTTSQKPDLRLILVARKGDEQDVADAVTTWREAFSKVAPEGIEFCVWLTGIEPTVTQKIAACVHTLHLNPLIDGYQRNPQHRMTWSPWGQKSGPNYQFFRILQEMSMLHPESWILQLELDTFPLRKVMPADMPWVYSTGELWVVGAGINDPASTGKHRGPMNHINGAAFYRIGDSNFRNFLARAWQVDLIQALQERPGLAFDVITSKAIEGRIRSEQRKSWGIESNHFRATGGMLNLLARPNSLPPPTSDQGPWFVHKRVE